MPDGPVEPMYMPGLCRTGSKPSRTVILLASYSAVLAMVWLDADVDVLKIRRRQMLIQLSDELFAAERNFLHDRVRLYFHDQGGVVESGDAYEVSQMPQLEVPGMLNDRQVRRETELFRKMLDVL